MRRLLRSRMTGCGWARLWGFSFAGLSDCPGRGLLAWLVEAGLQVCGDRDGAVDGLARDDAAEDAQAGADEHGPTETGAQRAGARGVEPGEEGEHGYGQQAGEPGDGLFVGSPIGGVFRALHAEQELGLGGPGYGLLMACFAVGNPPVWPCSSSGAREVTLPPPSRRARRRTANWAGSRPDRSKAPGLSCAVMLID